MDAEEKQALHRGVRIHANLAYAEHMQKGQRMAVLYTEINLICILILLLLLVKTLHGTGMQQAQRLLLRFFCSNILFLLMDMAWMLGDNHYLPDSRLLHFMISALYFMAVGASCYSWFAYSEEVQQSRFGTNEKCRRAAMLPVLVSFLLTVSSWWTGWCFFVDGENVYHRGSLYIVMILINYSYIVFTALKAFWRVGWRITGRRLAVRGEDYAKRQTNMTLASFIILPFLTGILQPFFPEIPLFGVGNMLAVLYVYIDFQDKLISVDPLTQLNNRNQLMRGLNGMMSHWDGRQKLYALLMDVDDFKQINDQYGHVEGDIALVRIARVLKKSAAGKKCVIARYGGDEFIIVCEAETRSEIELLCYKIRNWLASTNAEEKAPYDLTLSIGYAEYEKGMRTAAEFIRAADEKLYQVKKVRKQR